MKPTRTILLFSGLALILLLILIQSNLPATSIARAQTTPLGTLTPESFLPYIAKEPTWTPTPTPTATFTPTPTITPTPTLTPMVESVFFCREAAFVEWPDIDEGVIDDTLTIDESGTIVDLVLYVNIAHTYVGDLIIDLEHEDTNNIIQVMDRPGTDVLPGLGCPNNNLGIFFNDAAATPVEDACTDFNDGDLSPALFGNLQPDELLSSFDGEDLIGDWTLIVEDVFEGDAGILNAWCLFVDIQG